MIRAKGNWFRFYERTLYDTKILKLSDHLFRTWVNLLSSASRNGGVLPPIDDLSLILRLPAREVLKRLAQLEKAALIDRHICNDETVLSPHEWEEHQFNSDSSTKRVREFRKRKEAADETANETELKRCKGVSGNGFDSVSVSESESVGSSLSGKEESRGLDSQDRELGHSGDEP